MHNSPLKCQTNSESPDKKVSPKLQSQAYKYSSGSKRSDNFSSPTKGAAARCSPSPQKNAAALMLSGDKRENRLLVEDQAIRSPPQKKYASPSRDAKRSSPSKSHLPFGKSIEIIKSK